jgi:hypothetical protein
VADCHQSVKDRRKYRLADFRLKNYFNVKHFIDFAVSISKKRGKYNQKEMVENNHQ